MRNLRTWIVVFLIAMTILGCTTPTPAPTNTSASPSLQNTQASPTEAKTQESKASKNWKIAFIPQLIGIPYFTAMEEGGNDAAKAFGVTYLNVGSPTASAAEQVRLMENLIQQRVDAISISVLDSASLNPVMERAEQVGIVVYTSDSDSPNSVRRVYVAQALDKDLGYTLIDRLALQIGEAGQIGIISGESTATNLNTWIEFMKEAVKTKYPNIEIVDIRYTQGGSSEDALRQAEELMTRYPDLKGLIAVASTTVPGVAKAVENAGKTGQVAVIGYGSPNTVRPFIKSGVMKESILWNPRALGYLNVWAGIQLLEGKPFQEENIVPGLPDPVKYFPDTLLRLSNISKSFGGVKALAGVSFTANSGKVHAIVGENGAGKSTLMRIISGALRPDSGRVEWNGREYIFQEPRDASKLGISIVYQEPLFFNDLSVVENLFLGEEMKKSNGILDWKTMTEKGVEALTQIDLTPEIIKKPMSGLSLGVKQLVLIARAVQRNAKLLILDEPTAILSQRETQILFQTIHALKDNGVSILYISHRLAEIFEIADCVTVLRDGQVVMETKVSETNENDLINAMTGRKISTDIYTPREFHQNEPLLSVHNLTCEGYYQNISFTVKPKQILAFYGLVGAGRSEVAKTIIGEMQADAGEIIFEGRKINPKSSREAISLGIVYLPEDRRAQGLFLIRSIKDNIIASKLQSISSRIGKINSILEKSIVTQVFQNLSIKAPSIEIPVSSLSGGNQQKVVMGRNLTLNPRLLILDAPTHGIDVGTKNEIHKLIFELANKGVAILLITSDLPEALAIADSFVVMHEGHLMGILDRQEATEETLLRLALGINGNNRRNKWS